MTFRSNREREEESRKEEVIPLKTIHVDDSKNVDKMEGGKNAVLETLTNDFTSTSLFRFGIAAIYVGLWTMYPVFANLSKKHVPGYNNVAVVLLIDSVKLSVASGICLYTGVSWLSRWKEGLPYAVPAAIYAVYNALALLNLSRFDPASYQVIMNLRIVFAGILFERIFNKRLGPVKWIAIVILCVGVSLLKLENGRFQFSWALSLVVFQASLSSLAGVYNEYLLKGKSLPLAAQNAWMYAFSVIVNIFGAYYNAGEAGFDPMELLPLALNKWVTPVIVIGSMAGFTTALLLKYLNVVTKAVCTSTEMLLTAFISYFFLGATYNMMQMFSIFMVAVAVFVYSGVPDATRYRIDNQITNAWTNVIGGQVGSGGSNLRSV